MSSELKENYNKIEHQVNGLRQDFQNIQNSLKRIETWLTPEKESGLIGLVEQVKIINLKVTEIDGIVKLLLKDNEIKRAKATVWATVFGAIGAGLVYLFKELISIIIK